MALSESWYINIDTQRNKSIQINWKIQIIWKGHPRLYLYTTSVSPWYVMGSLTLFALHYILFPGEIQLKAEFHLEKKFDYRESLNGLKCCKNSLPLIFLQWRNQNKRATWATRATDQHHQCHIECFINLRAGQPGQSKGQPGHCPQLPRCSYATVFLWLVYCGQTKKIVSSSFSEIKYYLVTFLEKLTIRTT